MLKKKLLEIHLINKNTKKVWDALEKDRGYSYTQLISATELSRSTLYDALNRLEKDGFVERIKEGKKDGTKGRPKISWWLTETGEFFK